MYNVCLLRDGAWRSSSQPNRWLESVTGISARNLGRTGTWVFIFFQNLDFISFLYHTLLPMLTSATDSHSWRPIIRWGFHKENSNIWVKLKENDRSKQSRRWSEESSDQRLRCLLLSLLWDTRHKWVNEIFHTVICTRHILVSVALSAWWP